ncbi:MAG: exodeoxyribonuclease III [Akkermansiaceae bacterium]|nr:exodeoxyribonuclease III [Akkermansiaceae bacterium]MCP5550891.1 exodeoxyribonuclease III [Akkermansiaceae bacterium]
MKLHSWNVNGIRATLGKGFENYLLLHRPDLLLIQETKAHPDQVQLPDSLSDWSVHWNSAERKGYSGVATFTREQPLNVTRGLGIAEHDTEGRVLTLEFPDFHLVNVYTPNSQDGLRRLDYRQEWDRAFLAHMRKLEKEKPVIFAGDLNVAHTEIDLARPRDNRKNAGFTDEERAGFDAIVDAGFVDSFRHFHPGETGQYSWWSFRGGARARNVGWRIDYFCVSGKLIDRARSAAIHSAVTGSDHCPVELILH